jgi:ribosomal protein S1
MLSKPESDRKGILLRGFVTQIDRDFILVSVPRGPGIVHTFRINEDYVPVDIGELKINDEIVIELLRREYCHISIDLTDEEGRALPSSWHYDLSKKKLLVPSCLENKEIGSSRFRKETIERIVKESWRYGFEAKVVDVAGLQEVYEILKRSIQVNGKVIKEIRDKERRITGVRILVEVETSVGRRTVKGFLPFRECSHLKINSPFDVLCVGEVLSLRVIGVNPLILSRKRAFIACAEILRKDREIVKKTIGYLMGKGKHRKKEIIENLDADIIPDEENALIRVEAASKKEMDIVCEKISSLLRGITPFRQE